MRKIFYNFATLYSGATFLIHLSLNTATIMSLYLNIGSQIVEENRFLIRRFTKYSFKMPQNEDRRKTSRDYYFLRIVGEGSFSTVYLAVEGETKREFASKFPNTLLSKIHTIFSINSLSYS